MRFSLGRAGWACAILALLPGCISSSYVPELARIQDDLAPLKSTDLRGEAALQAEGTAHYAGVMTISTFAGALGLADTRVLYGETTVTADLANGGRVTGGVSRIEDLGGAGYDGSLTLTSGQMDPGAALRFLAEEDYGLLGDMSGTLTAPDGAALILDGTVTGRVWGAEAEILETFFDGTVQVDGDSGLAFGEGALEAQTAP